MTKRRLSEQPKPFFLARTTGKCVVSYREWFKLIVTAFLVSCGMTAVAFALGWLAG